VPTRKKARLTKRLQSQYNQILQGNIPGHYEYGYGFGWPIGGAGSGAIGWVAYLFAKEWSGREGVDLKKLQGIVLRSGDAECAWRFARDIPAANKRRLQTLVMQTGGANQMRKFAAHVPGADKQTLENLAIVSEIMNM